MSSHPSCSQLITVQEPAGASTEQIRLCLRPMSSIISLSTDTEQSPDPSPKSSPTSTKFMLSSLLEDELDGNSSSNAHVALVDHPYARITARTANSLRTRRSWNHALEKLIFTSNEIVGSSAPSRRAAYFASLEAHTDQLHQQLLDLGFYPVHFSTLEPFRGLNIPLAKGMIAGFQHDLNKADIRLLELHRAIDSLRKALEEPTAEMSTDSRA